VLDHEHACAGGSLQALCAGPCHHQLDTPGEPRSQSADVTALCHAGLSLLLAAALYRCAYCPPHTYNNFWPGDFDGPGFRAQCRPCQDYYEAYGWGNTGCRRCGAGKVIHLHVARGTAGHVQPHQGACAWHSTACAANCAGNLCQLSQLCP
jgi:hypothetical protein